MTARARTVDRFLSRAGVASRTGAARLVAEGRVAVNGRRVDDPGLWIDAERDRVTVDGRRVAARSSRRVIVFNKPRGVVTTASDERGRATVHDVLPAPWAGDPALRPIGRLDRATGGLLLFTDDTDLADRVLGPGSGVVKVYRVKVVPPPGPEALARLRGGLEIGDGRTTLPADVVVLRDGARSVVLSIGLAEGRNRQVRRMVEAVGGRVDWLVRTAFGPIALGDLEVGAAREATEDEVRALAP